MTLTLGASANTVPGAAVLTITSTSPLTSLTRSDRNGTRPVRLTAGALPFTGSREFRDHEPCLAGPVQYRASTADGMAEAWTNLGGQGPRFTLPATPLLTVGVDTVFDYNAGRSSRACRAPRHGDSARRLGYADQVSAKPHDRDPEEGDARGGPRHAALLLRRRS